MINPRGSTGFGQKFTEEISGDWGGKATDDLMSGLEHVLVKYPFTDKTRVAAAGGSYGGYMIDWLASQSRGRFRALISHAGVYDLTSMYGATEELWFPEHEFGGTPWTNPSGYQKFSPHIVRRRVRQVQDADARDRGRAGLSSALHTEPRVLHRAAASGGSVATRPVPR